MRIAFEQITNLKIASVAHRVTTLCVFALSALVTTPCPSLAQAAPGGSADSLSRCQGPARGPGTIVGSTAALTQTSATILIQIVPAWSDSDAYLASIATAFAGAAASNTAQVTSVAQLERQQAEAQAMPRVIAQTKFLFTDRARAFRCDGLSAGRYHVIAIVPNTAAPANPPRGQSVPSAVIDYYATDVTIPNSPMHGLEVLRAAGFHRIARAIGH